jgi:2,5-diketo-D-gluconate reductase B
MAIETKQIQGTQVPALGLGTWLLEGDDCRRATEEALRMGYRHVDTAQVYGNEDEVGQAVEASGVDRAELWLTTKLWNSRLEPDRVRTSFEDSLRKLRTEYVDLLLIHWPVRMDILPATLEAMLALRDEGKVRQIGVSNFTAPQVVEALRHAPVFCNQVEYHPYLGQERLRKLCRERDLLLTAYSPIARGKVLDDPLLLEIGRAHGKSPAQVSLRWLLDQPHVAAVPKATSSRHLAANLDVFDFSLTEDERARIDGLERGDRLVDPEWAPDWAA